MSILRAGKLRASRAFSLAEVVAVVVIIGVLAAIALPRFAGAMVNHRLDMAATRIAADLSRVQREARSASTSQSIVFSPDENRYRMPALPDMDHPGKAYVVELSKAPYEAALVAADFDGDTEIIFDGYGIPDSGGSVVIQVGDGQKIITVDAESGRATVSQ